MGVFALIFAIDVMISSLCMYIATKFSFVKIELKPLLVIVFLVAIVSLIPSIGWLLGIVLFVYLLSRAADASMVDSIWVVVFTKVVSFIGIVFLSAVFY